MTTLPVAEARDQLSRLVADADSFHERIEITRNGRRAAIIMGADDYDTMLETLAVLSNSQLVADIREALTEFETSGALSAGEFANRLRAAGKLPDADA